MELFIHDETVTMIGIVDEIKALLWTRRYWDCGEFKLLVPLTPRHAALLQNGRLIARKDADEMGQIRYIHITRDESGFEQIEVQGKFLTHWIGQRLLLSQMVMTAPTDAFLRQIVRETLAEPIDPRRRIDNLRVDETPLADIATLGHTADTYRNALDVCSERAKLAKLGFKIVSDVRTREHRFVVYKGIDHTASQQQNAICIFSPDFDNVLTQEFAQSVENVATAVYVGGAVETAQPPEETPPQEVVEVGDSAQAGIHRIEYFYDATGLSRTYAEDGQQVRIPDADYTALLAARGAQALDQKGESLSFSSVINTRANLRYKKDFDVGDRITCLNQRWKLQIDARITEITESYESGKESLEATFGVSIPTIHDMLKWR